MLHCLRNCLPKNMCNYFIDVYGFRLNQNFPICTWIHRNMLQGVTLQTLWLYQTVIQIQFCEPFKWEQHKCGKFFLLPYLFQGCQLLRICLAWEIKNVHLDLGWIFVLLTCQKKKKKKKPAMQIFKKGLWSKTLGTFRHIFCTLNYIHHDAGDLICSASERESVEVGDSLSMRESWWPCLFICCDYLCMYSDLHTLVLKSS